jgi:hypothetical protein
MWSGEGLYLGRSGGDLYTLRSWRSDVVKFGKVLCQNCNNVRSQPFDRAYDVYADFIQSNMARLTRARSIDWREVYGADWQEASRLLGCYAVKNFGCWIAESGFAPSKVLATFLDGGELVDARLRLTRQHRRPSPIARFSWTENRPSTEASECLELWAGSTRSAPV